MGCINNNISFKFYFIMNIKKIINEEISKFIIKDFVSKLSNGKYQILKSGFGEKAYNYTTPNGIEITLKIDYDPYEINNIEVSPDLTIDYIGNNNIESRGGGNASSEFKKIISLADVYNISLGIEANSEEATHNIQGTKTGEIGLTNNNLINWYKKHEFIFDSDSNFGYRPSRLEDKKKYVEREIKIPKQNINIKDIEFYSDPDTFNDDIMYGNIKDGVYEDGTEKLFLIKNNIKYLISNLKTDYDFTTNITNIVEI